MKIGIIRLSSLGDVILATAVLKGLREAHPGSEIVFIVRSEYEDVFKNNSYLNRRIAWQKGGRFKDLLDTVKRERFNILVDLHSNVRSHSITAFSGAKRVVRYRKAHFSRRLSVLRKKKPPMRHVVDRYFDAVESLGVRTSGRPAVYPSVDDMEWADEFLQGHGYSSGSLVGIAPGAEKMTKMWPAQKYGAVAEKLISEMSAGVMMVGNSGDVEVGKEVMGKCAEVMNAIDETDIGRLGALFSKCDLVISNDSAPTHVAVAVNTPVVTIFGPTIEEFGFTPYGDGNATVSNELYCRPCSLHGTKECPEGHFRCMQEIDVDDVYDVANAMLRRGKQGTGER